MRTTEALANHVCESQPLPATLEHKGRRWTRSLCWVSTEQLFLRPRALTDFENMSCIEHNEWSHLKSFQEIETWQITKHRTCSDHNQFLILSSDFSFYMIISNNLFKNRNIYIYICSFCPSSFVTAHARTCSLHCAWKALCSSCKATHPGVIASPTGPSPTRNHLTDVEMVLFGSI